MERSFWGGSVSKCDRIKTIFGFSAGARDYHGKKKVRRALQSLTCEAAAELP
jgi:hypothetical protein